MSIWEILNNKWSHLGKIKKIVEILEKIRYHNPMKLEKILINRKHEMFWNMKLGRKGSTLRTINRKHEMFWNEREGDFEIVGNILTVNMKCFEILMSLPNDKIKRILTVNMKCFEMMIFPSNQNIYAQINRKHEMFWNITN